MPTSEEDVLRAHYDDGATTYERKVAPMTRYLPRARAFLAAHAKPGSRVLDVGCGPGHVTSWLDPRVHVSGFDLSREMVACAARAHAGRPGRWLVHDLHAPLPDDLRGFDVVVALGCMEFCKDLDGALASLAAACRPGAALLVSVVLRRPGLAYHEEAEVPIDPRLPGVMIRFYTLAEMARAIEAAGLWAVRYEHGAGWYHASAGVDVEYAYWELARPG